MRITYQKDREFNMLAVLRKAGYNHFIDPNTNEESFVLRTGPDFYPRFHVYVIENGKTVGIDLHLDQKKAQYKGVRAHNGEYDGPVVEREITRLAGWMKSVYGVLPISSDALETTLRPQAGIGEANQPTAAYAPPQNAYKAPVQPPEENKKLFGGIF